MESQTVFGTKYVDEIVRWYRDGRGAMYVFQDANWNVTATVSHMTQPLDRIRTTPYGQPTFDVEVVNGDWDDDGDTDSADVDALLDCFSVGDTGDCRIFDYDDNGTINLNDYFDLRDGQCGCANVPRIVALRGARVEKSEVSGAVVGIGLQPAALCHGADHLTGWPRIVRRAGRVNQDRNLEAATGGMTETATGEMTETATGEMTETSDST